MPGPGKRRKFPRDVRLLRHADFERVYKQGKRHFAAHLTAFYRRREAGDTLRIGFTVSKLLGGAVQRNRMRRRLREAVRLHWPEFQAPVDIVINPKKSLLGIELSALGKEIGQMLEAVRKFAEKQH
ncbi:MAG: ribonuclease P protein component, partial [Terriglobales bacterium]